MLEAIEEIDTIVCAELPDRQEEPELYEAVSQHMFHRPCGTYNRQASCMENGICSKRSPKRFQEEIIITEEGYVVYRRRDNTDTAPPHPLPNFLAMTNQCDRAL